MPTARERSKITQCSLFMMIICSNNIFEMLKVMKMQMEKHFLR